MEAGVCGKLVTLYPQLSREQPWGQAIKHQGPPVVTASSETLPSKGSTTFQRQCHHLVTKYSNTLTYGGHHIQTPTLSNE